MNKRIAGHTFVSGACSCGRRWIDIRHIDASFKDEPGYAHAGGLTLFEIGEIVAEREDEEAAIAQAMTEARGY